MISKAVKAISKAVKTVRDYVGAGYDVFWRFKGRYRVCKGSRASKKSKTTALWYAVWLNKKGYENANLIVFRKTYRTIKDSCFTDLKWALERIGVINEWNITLSPLEMTRKKTGQKILFRGLDDTLKVTSITVEKGVLCWAWLEEAYEVMNEADFDVLDESIRGECPAPLFKQWTITFNPWNEHHWLKKRFFDAPPSPDILAITTNYLCNEWLDEADRRLFERMKKQNPRRYQVAGLGNWGIVDGLVYENWKEEAFDLDEVRSLPNVASAFGLDFGYTHDPSAFFCGLLDKENKRLFVFDEMYEKGMSNRRIYEAIQRMGYSKERITADSSEPKSIDELDGYGLHRIQAARKGKDSVKNGIQWIQDLEIIIHPRCVNFITEISNYTWDKDKFGKKLNVPIDDFNHLMDAMRYALEQFIEGDEWMH
ncbi:MAG: PBSX family phage terminase large subunit [Bacteroidaceae bacterium]|nr:PBSX family phage terminase large subunit [Bacteroidaceae bacterium]